MLKKSWIWMLTLALGASLLVAPAAQADPARFLERLQLRLGLTDDQAKGVQTVLAGDTDTRRQLRQAMGRARHDLRQLVLNGGDDAAIAAKLAEIESLHAQSLQLRVDVLRQIGPILTQEQRDLFAELRPMGPRGMRHGRPRTQS